MNIDDESEAQIKNDADQARRQILAEAKAEGQKLAEQRRVRDRAKRLKVTQQTSSSTSNDERVQVRAAQVYRENYQRKVEKTKKLAYKQHFCSECSIPPLDGVCGGVRGLGSSGL